MPDVFLVLVVKEARDQATVVLSLLIPKLQEETDVED